MISLGGVMEFRAGVGMEQISERVGFTVTADFLARMGFTPAATDKSAKQAPSARRLRGAR